MSLRPPVRVVDVARDLWPRISHSARALLAIATFAAVLIAGCMSRGHAEDVPPWVLRGIAHVESSSFYRTDGSLEYVNQKRGKAGEVGVFQAMPSTLRQFGFSPSLYEQDTAYSEQATRSILAHYFTVTGTWSESVASWRAGLRHRHHMHALDYVAKVIAAGGH